MPERVFPNSAYLNGLSTTGTNTRVKDVIGNGTILHKPCIVGICIPKRRYLK